MRRLATRAAGVAALACLAVTAGQTAAGGEIAALRGNARPADGASDALIHADVTRALGYTGQGVTVAILDTGIDEHNAGLAGSVTAEHCFALPGGCPNGTAEQDGAGSAQDDEGHGTAMASIIAGRGGVGPVGVAPDASLVVVKVADRNGRTAAPEIIAGLNWVLEHHPEVKVVNISLGSDTLLSGDCSNRTPSFVAYAAVVDALRAHGMSVFASSGNRGRRYSMTSPACLHSVDAVGAVYSRSFGSFTARNVCVDGKTAPDQVACFSDGGTELDLLAAGAPVDTPNLGSGDSLLAGTSAASAQAAGAAAALLQADPSLTPDALLPLLKNTGVPIRDPRNHFTTPRIDLAAALGVVLGHPVAVPTAPPDPPPPARTPVLSKPTVAPAARSSYWTSVPGQVSERR